MIIILNNVNDHIVYGIKINKITNSFMFLFDAHIHKKAKQNSYKEIIYFSSLLKQKLNRFYDSEN